MAEPAEHPSSESELQAPEALRGDLRALFGTEATVPPEVDAAILAAARQRIGRRRPWRILRWGAVAAAAAAVLLAVHFGTSRRAPLREAARPAAKARAPVREDIDRNGRVDILDAFALARSIDAKRRPRAEWDVTGDGVVDRKDIDTVALAAVSLERGTYR